MAKKIAKEFDENAQIQISKCDKVFKLVKDGKGRVIITIGNYKVSHIEFQTFQDADDYIMRKPWELIINVAGIINEASKNVNPNDQRELNKVKENEDK